MGPNDSQGKWDQLDIRANGPNGYQGKWDQLAIRANWTTCLSSKKNHADQNPLINLYSIKKEYFYHLKCQNPIRKIASTTLCQNPWVPKGAMDLHCLVHNTFIY